MAYGSPAPQPRTDLHRYIILLYEHRGRRIQVPKINTRSKFNIKQFVEKHNLGMNSKWIFGKKFAEVKGRKTPQIIIHC